MSLSKILVENANSVTETKTQVKLNGQPFSTFKYKTETLNSEVQAVKVISEDITGNTTMIYGSTKYGIWGQFKWGSSPSSSVTTVERIVSPSNTFRERFLSTEFISTTTSTVNLLEPGTRVISFGAPVQPAGIVTFASTSDILLSKVIHFNEENINNVRFTITGSDSDKFLYYVNSNGDITANNGTISGATYVDGIVGKYALQFDGINDVVNLSSAPTPTSLSAWVKRSDEDWKHIVSLNEDTAFLTKEKVYINNVESNYYETWKDESIIASSTENIESSRDATGSYTNTTTLSTSHQVLAEFTPASKTYANRVGIYVVNKGTGNWELVLRRKSDSLAFAQTALNDGLNTNLSNNSWWYFNCTSILEAGTTYELTIKSTVADGTVKSGTSSDITTTSYILYNAERQNSFTVISGGRTLNMASQDNFEGVLHGSVIDLDAGTYTLPNVSLGGYDESTAKRRNLIYSSKTGSNNYYNFLMRHGAGNYDIRLTNLGTELVIRIDTVLPAMHVDVTGISVSNTSRLYSVDYSLDGTNWTNLGRNINYSNFVASFNAQRKRVFYIKYYKHSTDNSGANYLNGAFKIEANLDLSGIPFSENKLGLQAGYYFEGKLDEVNMYSDNLDTTQINTLYNKNLVYDNLIHRYTFEEGAWTLAYDTINWEQVPYDTKYTLLQSGEELRYRIIANDSDLTLNLVQVEINK